MLPFWRFFIQKRQFTLLLMLALTAWGTVAAIQITKESAPEVQIPVGIVTTILPGASPDDVERLVTNKVEEQLANLQDLNTLTSSSREGVSTVVAEFNASADIKESIDKLKDEVDAVKAELPDEAEDPFVSEVNFVDQPIQIISITADLPFSRFAELGEEIKTELQSIRGVSRVEVSGVRDREINVVVRKEDLARLGISISEVAGAISAANASLPIGAIELNGINYNIKFEGDLDSVVDIADIPLLKISGQTIYLRDVATVSDGVERATSYSRLSVAGQPSEQALTLNVFKVRGEDVTTVTRDTRERLDELATTILAGSQVVVTYDLGDQVRKDLTQLTRTGLETTALVMISLLATIGWRESLAAGLSIPLSFLIAFIGLLYSGNTLNFVSLFSLILAIGILVDSGIVVTEAIHTRIRLFGDKKRAALESLREYAWPLIAGTFTTIAVFVPLFFISGIVGQFIASIPFTVIFVLVASIFVALGLVPYIAMSLSKTVHESRLEHLQEEYAVRARAWYANLLERVLDNKRFRRLFLTLLSVGFVVVLLLPIVGLMKVSFFPQEDSDFIFIDLEKPVGTTLNQTDFAVRAVEEILYEDPRIESIITTVGGTSAFSNAPQQDARFASITVNLKEDREQTSSEILTDLKRTLAPVSTIRIQVLQPTGGPPVGAPVLIKFIGESQEALDGALIAGERLLKDIPGTADITTSAAQASTEFTLRISREKLVDLGLNPQTVALALRTAVSGLTATTITGGQKDTDVVVSLNLNANFSDPHEANVATLDAVKQIPLRTPTGQVILLGSVLEESLSRSSATINHEDRKRVVTLSSQVLPGANAIEVTNVFLSRADELALQKGVTLEVGGENEETNQSFAEMGYALVAGLFLMFVILVLAFNSFRFTTYLLSIVPLSLIGVFAGLTLTGQPLSFPSLLGVIALAGIIINHAIILMDSIIHRLRASEAGKPFKQVVIESAVSRLRPIFLTTITTVIGMIPLIFASPLWGPLALAIMFGLTFAMILTLVLIPVLVYRWPGNLQKFRE